MLIKTYTWQLNDNDNERGKIIKKYCPHCRKTVLFVDSLKSRRNANGKNIFEFAIYKCTKDHTWNKKIGIYKAGQYNNRNVENEQNEEGNPQDSFSVTELKESGIELLEIYLERVKGKWRLDKLLDMYIIDISRSKIKKWINDKNILVNGQGTKAGFFIRSNQMISLILKEIPSQKKIEE